MAGNIPKVQQIGAEMRRAREDSGLTQQEVADRLGVHKGTVSKWESGTRTVKSKELARYLAEVGAPPELIADLMEAAQNPDESPWVAMGMPDQQRQLAALLEVERTATVITTVSPLLIPGLLQTSEYARAIMVAADVPPSEIETRVAVRVGRRDAIMRRRNPAKLRAFMWEPVLRQIIGSPDVMADQLKALLDYGALGNVDLRVITTACPWHPGLEGPFSVAQFADQGARVHLENRISGMFLHDGDDVEKYETALDRVREVAMSPTESAGLIADVINGKETTE
jgi:transcriptional regulator with XRE-family HTH domain